MTVRVGILGYGFMGRIHEGAFNAAAARGTDCTTRVVSMQDIMEGDAIDAVCICTPTDTHIELATAVLNAGKHVLLEKPVALRASEVCDLQVVAEKAGRICMPAHCMRFWPGWPYLKDVVDNRTFGRVLAAEFRRIAHQPDWNAEFYGNISKSGGALFDLHVHDVDFILWCFGQPDSFRCTGSVMDVQSEYAYNDLVIRAQGAWLGGDQPFEMTYRVQLEGVTLDFRHDREPALLLTEGGTTRGVDLPIPDAYEAQAAHFIRLVSGAETPVVTLVDAERAILQLEREERSLKK